MAKNTDYYRVLGVDEKAGGEDIKEAYRRLAKKYHPDANPSDTSAAERFKEISEAHSVLSDPDKRKQYDLMRKYGAFTPRTGGATGAARPRAEDFDFTKGFEGFGGLGVFATNLDPNDLADEAFLRRIPNKILVDAVNEDVFDRIFERLLREWGFSCEPETARFFRNLCFSMGGELRACQPADILNILLSISEFEGQELQIDSKSLTRAAGLYFAKPKGVADGCLKEVQLSPAA